MSIVAGEHRRHNGTGTRFGEAINRYLGAVGYRSERAARPSVRPAGTVLVGVDDTAASRAAVDQAAIEAELHGWELLMVHVRRPGSLRISTPDTAAVLLDRLTERVRTCAPSVPVTGRVAAGAASPLLLADAHDASLVVVGHRHGPIGSAFGLSVGDRVAAHHTGPVMVARVPAWPPVPGFGIRPLVVGLDRPDAHGAAVGFARREAAARGCEVILLYAGDDVTPAERTEVLDGVPVHHRTLADDPVKALLEASDEAAAIVVGRRGPGGPATSLLGSVSRAMVQHAGCPVFLV